MLRWSIPIFFVCSCGFLAAAGCDEQNVAAGPTSRPAEPVSVHVAPIARGTIDRTVEIVGTLFGEEEAVISSKSAGRIVSTDADLGDRVAPGAVLAQVDPTDYRFTLEQRQLALGEALAKLGLTQLPPEDFDAAKVATVERAEVQTENAKARLDRASQLYRQDPPLISEQEYADIETQYRVFQRDYDVAVLEAQSTLASAKSLDAAARIARQQLDDTTIRAPQSQSFGPDAVWAVAERRVSIGELVQSGTTVFKVIADRTVKLRASVPERYAGVVARDQPVALRVESNPDSAVGTVSRVSPSVDPTSRTFMIEVTFDNSAGRLRPGAFARGTIKVGTRNDVSILPPAALYSFAGLDKVFTVADGKAVQHTVNVLEQTQDRVVIEGDLGGATEAVSSGLARLTDKSPVVIEKN